MNFSDPITLALSTILCLFLALLIYGQKKSKFNLPPGPRPLPIIGNLHILDRNRPYLTMHELSKKYGPVYTIKLGEEKVVVLCGYDAVKDALVNHAEEFSDRPKVPIFHEAIKGHGVIFAFDDNWKVMRRFTLSTLRDFGMGKETIENKISEESDFLVKKFRSYKGEPFDNTMTINAAVANIIVSILLSNRFDYEDPTLLKLLKIANDNVHLLGSPMAMLYNAYPSVMRWCSRVQKMVSRNIDEMHAFIRETFTNQRKELDINDQRNLIDSFLVKQREGTHVIPLLTSVLYDKDHFAKADEFYPGHFLDSSGNFVRKEAFMPFSAGKRSCAGESLAKMELFMFFIKLLQNFTFQAPPGVTLDLTPGVGLTASPMAHKICAITRL